jgi:hypothetical protein
MVDLLERPPLWFEGCRGNARTEAEHCFLGRSVSALSNERRCDYLVLCFGRSKVVCAVRPIWRYARFGLSIVSPLDSPQQPRLECSEFRYNGPWETMYPSQRSE